MKKFKIKFKGKSRGHLGIDYVVERVFEFFGYPTTEEAKEKVSEQYGEVTILYILEA
jgi:hypothetical protein